MLIGQNHWNQHPWFWEIYKAKPLQLTFHILISITVILYLHITPAAVKSMCCQMPVTSIIRVMTELSSLIKCTTGRALAVTANTAILTPGYKSQPRVSASTQISPQALFLPKQILAMDPKQRHSPPPPPPTTPLASLSVLLLCLSGSSRCRSLQRGMGVGLMVWLVKSPPIPSGVKLEVSHSP